MANEGASSSNIPADSTGSDSHNESTSEIHSNNTISEDISGIGGSDELQKKSPGEQSLDAEFPTPGDYLSECPDCCYPRRTGSPLRPGSPQHTEYCLNIFVRQGNETSSTDNRQEHISELQGKHCLRGVSPYGLLIKSRNPASVYRYSLVGYLDRFISIHPRCRPKCPHYTNGNISRYLWTYNRRESWHGWARVGFLFYTASSSTTWYRQPTPASHGICKTHLQWCCLIRWTKVSLSQDLRLIFPITC